MSSAHKAVGSRIEWMKGANPSAMPLSRSRPVLQFGRQVLLDEARALQTLSQGLGEPFERAVELIRGCSGKLIVSGLGKSGHVARKIAATFASTGTTAIFLHLAEAVHGDLGMATHNDVALLISQSGRTAELEPVIDHFQRIGIPIVGITGNPASPLARASAAPLLLPAAKEVGPEAVAPTTSTTMAIALGDALAMAVMQLKGFTRLDFGRLHPGGALGTRLKPVARLMHWGDELPLANSRGSMREVIVEMSAKRLGVIGVTDDEGFLIGIITDGDLRRNIERGVDHTAAEFMSHNPKTVLTDTLIDDALSLFDRHKITALFVVEEDGSGRKRPVGVLHIHDCTGAR